MATITETLALARRLRRDAQETDLPSFAQLFVRTAEELEEFVRRQQSVDASRLLRKTG